MQKKHNAASDAVFKRGRAELWTAERIAKLSKSDIQQLQANAQRLGETGVLDLCVQALKPARARK